MNNLKKYLCLGVIIGASLNSISNVQANTNANLALIGENEAKVNTTFNLDIAVQNNNNSIITIGGMLEVSDPSCLTLVKQTPVINGVTTNNSKYALISIDGLTNDFSLVTATFKTNQKACTANIKIKEGTIYFINDEYLSDLTTTKTINVTEEEVIREQKVIETNKEETEKPENIVSITPNIPQNVSKQVPVVQKQSVEQPKKIELFVKKDTQEEPKTVIQEEVTNQTETKKETILTKINNIFKKISTFFTNLLK